MANEVTVADLVKKTRLKVLQGDKYLDRVVTTSDISRAGLELTGYFKYYPAMRVQ